MVEVLVAKGPKGTSHFPTIPPLITSCDLLPALESLALHPPIQGSVGGSLAKHVQNWGKITRDPWVMQTAAGYHLELNGQPHQQRAPAWPRFSHTQKTQLNAEITKLAEKGAIEPTSDTNDQFLSFIFLRPKKDGSMRPIINLKPFNQSVTYHHFKMEGIHLVLDMIQKGESFTKIDLKDAYFAVLINDPDRKYLRFRWDNQTYQFRACPFGLASAPRMFTKLMKPITAILRRMGVKLVIYLDDMILLNQDRILLIKQTQSTLWLLQCLGFHINWDKSIIDPTNKIEFLGFDIDAVEMKVKLPEEKKEHIKEQCRRHLQQETSTVRELAALIGKLVAAVRAVAPGPLNFRQLQMQKTRGLIKHGMNYEARIRLTPECRAEIRWWAEELDTLNRNSTSGRAQT